MSPNRNESQKVLYVFPVGPSLPPPDLLSSFDKWCMEKNTKYQGCWCGRPGSLAAEGSVSPHPATVSVRTCEVGGRYIPPSSPSGCGCTEVYTPSTRLPDSLQPSVKFQGIVCVCRRGFRLCSACERCRSLILLRFFMRIDSLLCVFDC